ncbi:hypothetical protein ACQR1I_25365 [Bradyrhizobium sp. HKCCYLS2038]|uniref:hypothetical protein n=1 Tax=unclassified Bradyrhizobium TaxID=2631580 RepID=UPI003EBFB3CD
MTKILMLSSVAAISAIVAMPWGAQPARSSQDWLAKAQSEFATKARDAVIQRKIGADAGTAVPNTIQAPSTVEAADQPAAIRSQPAAMPAVVAVQDVPATPERDSSTAMVLASAPTQTMITPPAKPALDEPIPPPAVVPVAAPAREDSKPADVLSQQPVDATPAQPAPAVSTAAPTTAPAKVAEPAARNETTQKPRRASKAVASAQSSRRSGSSNALEERGLQALRQHAPDIAAMVARYM